MTHTGQGEISLPQFYFKEVTHEHHNKLIHKMMDIPTDFQEADLDRILTHFQYTRTNTSGSGIKYYCPETGSLIAFHRPHKKGGKQCVKASTINDVIAELKKTTGATDSRFLYAT